MKKILSIIPVLLVLLLACEEEEPLVLDIPPTLAFLENNLQITLAHDFSQDTSYTATIQLIGKPVSQASDIAITLSDSSSAILDQHISFPGNAPFTQGSHAVTVEVIIKGASLSEEESVIAMMELSSDEFETGVNVGYLTVLIEKLAKPECTKDFSDYTTSLSVTTGDSFDYFWDWDGATDRTLNQDEVVTNRFSNSHFYGWSDSQPVFFELSCTDNSVNVIPISQYVTGNGYTFEITGGSGTYDDDLKKITVNYNCIHASDGEFTITETYTKVCGVDASAYTGPLGIQTGDSFGYSWDWNGATDLTLTVDSEVANRLVNTNFYGWSNAQPVFFDLSCDDHTISVVPITGYATGNGYTFDITGGSGTYDTATKTIDVTYECSHETDGTFTISETYN